MISGQRLNMNKRAGLIIIFLVIIVTVLRTWASLSVPYLSDDSSYQNLRMTSGLTFSNIVNDPYSFGGRLIILNPFSTNLLAIFHSATQPILAYKIILNFIAALTIAVIFLISLRLTKRTSHAVLVAILAACIPLQYLITLNSVSIIPIALLLFLLAIYYYIAQTQEPTKMRLILCIILFLASAILHPLFLLFLCGFIIGLFYCRILGQRATHFERELLVATLLVAIVANYIIYVKAFLVHGISALFEWTLFVPYIHLSQILSLLPQMGLVIFAAAMYTLFNAFEKGKSRPIFIFAGIMSSAFMATSFRVISADIGLIIISVMSVLILPYFFDDTYDYFCQTKFYQRATVIIYGVWIILFVLSIIPTLIYSKDVLSQSTSPALVEALKWIDMAAEQNATVVIPIQYAQTAMYFAQRKTIMDQNVLLEDNPQSRADAINQIYTTPYSSTILSILQSFGVTKQEPAYIVFLDDQSMPKATTMLGYQNDCFATVFTNSNVKIFKSLCEVREQ